jgi:hypothetical protein
MNTRPRLDLTHLDTVPARYEFTPTLFNQKVGRVVRDLRKQLAWEIAYRKHGFAPAIQHDEYEISCVIDDGERIEDKLRLLGGTLAEITLEDSPGDMVTPGLRNWETNVERLVFDIADADVGTSSFDRDDFTFDHHAKAQCQWYWLDITYRCTEDVWIGERRFVVLDIHRIEEQQP